MDIDLGSFMNVAICVACLGVGFIVKYSISAINNKYIPLIVFILGVILSFVMSGISIDSFNTGWVSGIASTGLYELVENLMKKENTEENK